MSFVKEMKIRRLMDKDAEFMLEWMHDSDVVGCLKTDFNSLGLNDCKDFIAKSLVDVENLHFAIVDDNDDYQGTVSLKHISIRNAEFAITIRKSAMGRGLSQFGMEAVLNMAVNELGLDEVYWCVDKQNLRARKFYDKSGYKRIDIYEEPDILFCAGKHYDTQQISSYLWYKFSAGGK